VRTDADIVSQAPRQSCPPDSPDSMRSRRRSNRCAVAFFIAPEKLWVFAPLGHRIRVDPGRRLASSSVNPTAIASAILTTTSGVRLVGRPSPSLPRLLMLCAGSLFMPSCHFSFFVRPGNSVRFPTGWSQDGATLRLSRKSFDWSFTRETSCEGGA
jgi:hypothetical protein